MPRLAVLLFRQTAVHLCQLGIEQSSLCHQQARDCAQMAAKSAARYTAGI